MQYPLISEYITAIRDAEDNFATLTNLRPVMDRNGNPVMSSGNFAVVFKMSDGKKNYALKCFTRDMEGRAEAYKKISGAIISMEPNPYMISVSYLDKELFVDNAQTDETEFPVLLMEWVDGMCLDEYVDKIRKDESIRNKLVADFQTLVLWLLQQPFAHGDLKPDNIIVKPDGSLVLIDYDGMYVPSMKGQQSKEIGTPPFTHKDRKVNDFDESIDDYASILILLILKIIAIEPVKFDEYLVDDIRAFLSKTAAFVEYKDIAPLLSAYIYANAYGRLDRNIFNLNTLLFREKKQERTIKNEINGHEYVDLGLPSGLKWATCNVGASKPEEYGDYYAWGETETKAEYIRENSKTYGMFIGNISGNPKYDVARKKLGSTWRIPTRTEMYELENYCKWEWVTQNGVKGLKVTGPNGHSIFLPAAGFRSRTSLDLAGKYGGYWSSTPHESYSYRAYYLYFNSSYQFLHWYNRYDGQSVRPVSE